MSATILQFTAERPVNRAWRKYQEHTLEGRRLGLLDDPDWEYENIKLHRVFYDLMLVTDVGGNANVIPFGRRCK